MTEKILLVDDELNVLQGYKRSLRNKFDIETALGPEEGLKALSANGPFAVVVSDMQMPEMNGIQFLAQVKQKNADTVRIMLTGNADQQTAIEAINEGNIFRFLTKPCSPEKLGQVLTAGIDQYRLINAEKELLEKTLAGSVTMLTEILSVFDNDLFGKSTRLRDQIQEFSEYLNIPLSWEFEIASLLSQIGYLSVPPDLLVKAQKQQKLSPSEKEILDQVPEFGGRLLEHIPRLKPVSKIILYQNKRFDGSGFPEDSVSGKEIPLGAQMIKIFSDLVEMESNNATREEIIETLKSRTDWYDQNIIKKVICFLSDQKTGELDLTKASISVFLDDLRPGDMILSDIKNNDGSLLLSAGQKISKVQLERLCNIAKTTGIQEPIEIKKR